MTYTYQDEEDYGTCDCCGVKEDSVCYDDASGVYLCYKCLMSYMEN